MTIQMLLHLVLLIIKQNKRKITYAQMYNKENCTYFNMPYHPCNLSIRVYALSMYISRLLVPIDNIQTPIFTPIIHQNSESILVLGVQMYNHPCNWDYQSFTQSHLTDITMVLITHLGSNLSL